MCCQRKKSTQKISYNNKTSKSQSLNFLLWILHHKQLKCQTQSHLGKKKYSNLNTSLLTRTPRVFRGSFLFFGQIVC